MRGTAARPAPRTRRGHISALALDARANRPALPIHIELLAEQQLLSSRFHLKCEQGESPAQDEASVAIIAIVIYCNTVPYCTIVLLRGRIIAIIIGNLSFIVF